MPLGSVCRLLYTTAQIGAKPQEENMKPSQRAVKVQKSYCFHGGNGKVPVDRMSQQSAGQCLYSPIATKRMTILLRCMRTDGMWCLTASRTWHLPRTQKKATLWCTSVKYKAIITTISHSLDFCALHHNITETLDCEFTPRKMHPL
jgi:hypothetical protein